MRKSFFKNTSFEGRDIFYREKMVENVKILSKKYLGNVDYIV